MAIFPCSVGKHFYPGPQLAAYFNVAKGDDVDGWKLRLCPGHVSEIQGDLAQFKVDIADDAVGRSNFAPQCVTCLQPTGEVDWQLFVTIYPTKQEREDYWTALHVDCNVPARWTENKVNRK